MEYEGYLLLGRLSDELFILDFLLEMFQNGQLGAEEYVERSKDCLIRGQHLSELLRASCDEEVVPSHSGKIN